MTPLRILVTASGAPGSPRLLRALRENGERPVHLTGVDMRSESAGRFLCDGFSLVLGSTISTYTGAAEPAAVAVPAEAAGAPRECVHCGHKARPAAKRCGHCGEPFEAGAS